MTKFFSDDVTNTKIIKFIVDLKNAKGSAVHLKLLDMLTALLYNPVHFDTICTYTILKYRKFPLELLDNAFPRAHIEDLFCIAYTAIFEASLKSPNVKSKEILQPIIDSILENYGDFPTAIKKHIVTIAYEINSTIITDFRNSPEIAAITLFARSRKELIDDFESQTEKLNNQISEVNNLRNLLLKYESAFNFVGLYDGFKELRDKKSKSLSKLTYVLIFFGALMILTPIVELSQLNSLTVSDIPKVTVGVAIEFLLIYFFRIILTNHTNTKAEMLQIDLRMSLCQFMQNYVKFAEEKKIDLSKLFEKFDSLIFSNLVSNPEKIPSQFDGIESIARLIEAVKSKK